eukprot:COSAG02_NODE_50711_length_318_cov_3.000000_1_plen_57_part_01
MLSAKGKPGDDSVNACMPVDAIRCKYSSFHLFLQAVDILASSGVEVDTVHDDFASYY